MLHSTNCVLLAAILSLAVVRGTLIGSRVSFVQKSHFPMGEAKVTICREAPKTHVHHKRELNQQSKHDQPANSTDQSEPSLITVDLTPAKFNTTCYPGTFQAPSIDDCAVVIRAQLYNSTGSLQASPGDYVFVSYGTCATVFQNPQTSDFNLEYNWAELGAVGKKLLSRCLLPQDYSMGGAAAFKPYLGYNFPEVMMSLQRFDDRDLAIS